MSSAYLGEYISSIVLLPALIIFTVLIYFYCSLLFLFIFTVLYSFLLFLYCFTVLYSLLLFCNNFTVLYCLCQDVLFLLPHADIHHINRIHKKHDNTFCAVDFSGCPCKSPYNHTHDDQDDNINDILHEECNRADRCCNTED